MNDPWENISSVACLAWSAWAPGRPDRAAWESWAQTPAADAGASSTSGDETVDSKAPCQDLPPLLRRRCSSLTRMVVETAFAACRAAAVDPSTVATVFCSRHGEIRVIRELLDTLHAREPFSPTLFSNSVHHTPTGYFDLACGNRHPSKTLSAGDANLVCGFLESLGALRAGPAQVCLLVVADETVPSPFQNGVLPPPFPYALALVLAPPPARSNHPLLTLARRAGTDAPRPAAGDVTLDFLRWLVHNDGPFEMSTPFGNWRWTNTIGRPS